MKKKIRKSSLRKQAYLPVYPPEEGRQGSRGLNGIPPARGGAGMTYIKALMLTVVGVIIFSPLLFAGTEWKQLSNGVNYTGIKMNPGTIHAFKIDPKKHKFGVVTAAGLGKEMATAEIFAKRSRALIAVNGGFFSPEYKSLGLIVSDGKEINPVKNTSWWSVFYISKNKPYIVHTSKYKKNISADMAIQSGPRLLVDGTIPKLKPAYAERSALCINSANQVLVIATENMVIQPIAFADILKKSEVEDGLGCASALNLDGGSSTQIYAKIGSFKLDVEGMKGVANAVVVY